MALSSTLTDIVEYRGVEGLVAAEVLTDDNESGGGYTTGAVFAIAGVAEISKTVEQASEAHYYDNIAAIVIEAEGADTVTISASAIPLEVKAKLTGQTFDATTGALIESNAVNPYFALGYKTKKTDGTDIYVWRFKGKFALGDETNVTIDNGTDANGQELTFTGVSTIHKFTKNGGKGAKALIVDDGLGLANVSTFFDTVTTPDSLTAKSA